ncbi:hypothetical protein F3Y22_tig00110500pilonHSYRG00072 [Hibiscus syriacus]|uniref:Wall-associated receptor kinase galacturonan-binding domain-containing protein n=1 Tax=Hibiscus syriacus TaxID=106335 RepID=A0A6A3AEB3_HIBSY|nr:hypothetical protein F3Y22_tig00110500pilonHSYRG00072 [Hibiscus syriacus]
MSEGSTPYRMQGPSMVFVERKNPTLAANSKAKPGCKQSCGNTKVPYPFGIGLNCSLNSWFDVPCNDTSTHPAILLERTQLEVLNFSLRSSGYGSDLEFHRIKSPIISMNCLGIEASNGVDLTGNPFFFSEFKNRIVACTSGTVFVDWCNSTYMVEQNWRDLYMAVGSIGAVIDWAIPDDAFELSKSGKNIVVSSTV